MATTVNIAAALALAVLLLLLLGLGLCRLIIREQAQKVWDIPTAKAVAMLRLGHTAVLLGRKLFAHAAACGGGQYLVAGVQGLEGNGPRDGRATVPGVPTPVTGRAGYKVCVGAIQRGAACGSARCRGGDTRTPARGS